MRLAAGTRARRKPSFDASPRRVSIWLTVRISPPRPTSPMTTVPFEPQWGSKFLPDESETPTKASRHWLTVTGDNVERWGDDDLLAWIRTRSEGAVDLQGRRVDAMADIYSFGVMAYQVLTGELPFKHNSPGAMVMAHLMQPPTDPCTLAPELPARVGGAILRAMSKRPAERYASAGDFIAAMSSREERVAA